MTRRLHARWERTGWGSLHLCVGSQVVAIVGEPDRGTRKRAWWLNGEVAPSPTERSLRAAKAAAELAAFDLISQMRDALGRRLRGAR